MKNKMLKGISCQTFSDECFNIYQLDFSPGCQVNKKNLIRKT